MARVKQKKCEKCGTKKPLTGQFFKGSGASPDGFGKKCRDCAKRPVPISLRKKMEKAGTWVEEKVEEPKPKKKRAKRGAKKRAAVEAAVNHANGANSVESYVKIAAGVMDKMRISSITIVNGRVTWTETRETSL